MWVQILMSFVPPKTLNKIFPKVVTGSLLLLVGVYPDQQRHAELGWQLQLPWRYRILCTVSQRRRAEASAMVRTPSSGLNGPSF